jgi:hypothetical protein
MKRNRLTNNSDETDIANLVSSDSVFAIPFFQRSYKWKTERLKQLNSDVLAIVDGATEFHFLGAVIIHGRGSNPSDPKVYDVIDGQQRITTLFLYIGAAIKVLAELGECDEAQGLFLKYFAIGRKTSLASNLRLHPCREDRAQFNYVIDDLLSTPELGDKLRESHVKKLQSAGKATGIIRKNYRYLLRFFRSQQEQGGADRVRAVYGALLQSVSVVQIDVWDPTNGPKIFDSLNSRQEPMTIGDLVRNEIFSKVSSADYDEIEVIDRDSWQPFYRSFQEAGNRLFESYFFPFGLIQDANLRKSEVYAALRERWRQVEDPREIIRQLGHYQVAFIDIVTGRNSLGHSREISGLIRNLYLAGAPSSTYPFLMQLSKAVHEKRIAEHDAAGALRVVESFLVRRAICGHEPTGLHAVFKRLWSDCDEKPDDVRVAAEIRKHRTVTWPDNLAVREAISNRSLYGVGITKYLLREYDRSLGGDVPGDIPWIEHVLPSRPAAEWYQSFNEKQHHDMKDLLANLLPLSKEMNAALQNGPYEKKKRAYEDDSMFKSARAFAHQYCDWTPDGLGARSGVLADWCTARWAD